MNGENLLQGKKSKTLLGKFQVTTPKNLIIKNQAVTSIRNLTITFDYPKISTCTPILNWTWSCRDFLYARIPVCIKLPSNWLIVVGCKVLHFKACWRSGSTWLQNPRTHKNVVSFHRVYMFSKLSLVSMMILKWSFYII